MDIINCKKCKTAEFVNINWTLFGGCFVECRKCCRKTLTTGNNHHKAWELWKTINVKNKE